MADQTTPKTNAEILEELANPPADDELKLDENFDDFLSLGSENAESTKANQELEAMMALYGNKAATEDQEVQVQVQVTSSGIIK